MTKKPAHKKKYITTSRNRNNMNNKNNNKVNRVL